MMHLNYTILSIKKIAVETKSGVTSVLTCDIVYVEAKGRKVIVHTSTADLDSTQTLQFWIDHLPQATFFQSHRSYIVNMAMVTSFDHELIYLCDGQFTAYLTRRKFTEFKKAYLMFMESKRYYEYYNLLFFNLYCRSSDLYSIYF